MLDVGFRESMFHHLLDGTPSRSRRPMPKAWWLLLATAMLAVWNAGIVWFTQIAVYPLWPLVDAAHFHDYHLTWWHAMWPAFAPVVAMLACAVALLRARPTGVPGSWLWLGVVLQLAVHTLTLVYWAPLQAGLATPAGMAAPAYARLMDTHWLRVAFFFAYALLTLGMLRRSVAGVAPRPAPQAVPHAA